MVHNVAVRQILSNLKPLNIVRVDGNALYRPPLIRSRRLITLDNLQARLCGIAVRRIPGILNGRGPVTREYFLETCYGTVILIPSCNVQHINGCLATLFQLLIQVGTAEFRKARFD